MVKDSNELVGETLAELLSGSWDNNIKKQLGFNHCHHIADVMTAVLEDCVRWYFFQPPFSLYPRSCVETKVFSFNQYQYF